MTSRIHAFSGMLALLCVAVFWASTVTAELFFSTTAIAAVKQTILYGIALLIAAMAITGTSGLALARGRCGMLLSGKKRRMPVIAATGLLIMLPLAFYLAAKAGAGEPDHRFYVAQTLELVIGAMQMTLIAINLRDGWRMSGKRPSRGTACQT